jgi:hypothetical protein
MADFMMAHANVGGSEIMINRDWIVSASRIINKLSGDYTSLELHNGKTVDIREDVGAVAGPLRRP